MTIYALRFFLLLLLPHLALSSRESAEIDPWHKQPTHFAKRELTQGYPAFFSTHSANPWSRTRGIWRRGEPGSVLTRTVRVFRNESIVEVKDGGLGSYGGADLDVWSCPDSLTLSESIRYLLRNDCKGNNKQVARTFLIVAWLMVLFYLLGSTASDYFSCTLEKLSDTLRLSPAVAGVTLLAVGNGAPDVFSSVAAFMSSDKSGSIGLSCVLGGALFITTIVSGAVALVTDRESHKACLPKINLVCFVRDALFLLGSAAVLAFILLDGKVYLWEAVMFLSIYGIYAIFVWAAEVLEKRAKVMSPVEVEDPLLSKVMVESSLPQSLHMQQHLYHLHSQELVAELESFEQGKKVRPVFARIEQSLFLIYKHGIERPLAFPRQLTIPVIEEERWSRFFAVASCTLAPLFVGGVWIFQSDASTMLVYIVLGVSTCLGIVLGTLAFLNTEDAKPPSQFLWLWLGGGFFMSIVWFYIVADQVVASLETLGVIFSINPAILGLTVLAWGNCIGDLVADLALACGGRDGVQIAVSGCYAGPLFNMVVGLGLSLMLACWRSVPHPLAITDEDGTLFFIIGFFVAGLLWALVVLPLNNMRLSKGFGAGLLLLYGGFLVTGMCYAMGWISR
ncbi:hypothetical protein L7F22_013025 [Adiantum nelumboides]|nr:hypothetical protein [Adiantum nelumboides]